MKKVLLLITVLALSLTLIACGDNGGNGDNNEDEILLTYADWGNADFNQRMIDKFMEKYPHITVTLRPDIGGSGAEFTGNIVAAAQAGVLPDVFAIDNVPTAVNAGLTYDVATIWDNDEDAQKVYPGVALTGVYNGKRYAIPSFQFIKGIMINKDIFENANLTTVPGKYRMDEFGLPMKDWTFSEFIEITKAIKNFPGNDSTAVVGLDTWFGAPDFQQIWPMMNDADVQYDTWDGEAFHYTSQAWIDAMQTKIELEQLTDGTTLGRMDPETVVDNPHLQGLYISSGKVAMDIEGSWQFAQIGIAADNGIELGFWPYPSGAEGLFPPTILDYQVVSSQTLYPEEAFLLAKWMTFGEDGWDARLDLLEEDYQKAINEGTQPTPLIGFPVADYEGHAERINALVAGIDGLEYSLAHMDKSKPDLDKWLPGYKEFWAWVNDPENPFNYTSLVEAGPSAVPTYAAEWEDMANEIVQQQLAGLGAQE